MDTDHERKLREQKRALAARYAIEAGRASAQGDDIEAVVNRLIAESIIRTLE